MVPAREVGGDLYDFFLLDEHRLFFLIGDVSDKGLPASIFMAVSKALYKSTTLREQAGHRRIIRGEHPFRATMEMMFVTAFVGIWISKPANWTIQRRARTRT